MKAKRLDHTRETRLILEACRTKIPTESLDNIARILDGPIDWEYVAKITRRNAASSLFFSNILKLFGDRLSNDMKHVVEGELEWSAHRNMFLTSKLLEIIRIFNENNIEILPFKGPMLAIQAYGNPALRTYGDLDVLVRPRNFVSAVKLLKEHGYTAVTNVNWLERTTWYLGRKKDVYMVNKAGSVKLELHWKLSGAHFGLPKEMNGLWHRLDSVSLAGIDVPALSFNDLLIYLCLHGSRHGWERLAWICDINELVGSKQEVDWDLLFVESKRLGCEKVVALGLRLIRDFFGSNLPSHDWDKIKGDEKLYDDMIAEIRGRLFSEETKIFDIGEQYLYHLKLKERKSDRWKVHFHYISWYARIILTPGEIDKNILHLPSVLYPVYYVTRPLRLAYTYLIKSNKNNITETRI